LIDEAKTKYDHEFFERFAVSKSDIGSLNQQAAIEDYISSMTDIKEVELFILAMIK